MKILHITASMDPKLGGVCQALKTMVSGLNQEPNIQNEIISFDDPDASFIDTNSYQVHALGNGKGPWFYNAAYIPFLIENLQQFDVVILHGLWNFQGYGLVKAFKQLKANAKRSNASFSTKFFVMPHGMLDPYFQKASGRKLKAARNWIYWKLIERKVVHLADGLLFTCEAELQLARQTFSPYQPAKELVVGLGVEEPPDYQEAMKTAFQEKCPDLKEQPYLLFISRIHEKKGTDLLVDAYIKTINSEKDDTSFTNQKLVVAGPGIETAFGQKVKNLTTQLGDPKLHVFFPEMLTGAAKWGAFYGCEAFILPSHQENFGIAVVEALACGKPVLISNQVNIYQEIESANAGIIADDTEAGTSKLLKSWGDLSAEQQSEMKINARNCYEKYFSVKNATKNLFHALQQSTTNIN